MTDPYAPPTVAAEPLGRRLGATFLAPGRLFAAVRAGSPWVDALLVVALLAAIAAAGQPDEVYLEQVEGAVNRRGRPVTITSPPEVIVAWNRGLAFFSAVAAHPLIAFAVAGILALLFTVLRGGRAGYRDYLTLASHVLVIPALGSVLLLPLQWSAGEPGVTASAGAFLGEAPSGLLARTLAGVDLFTLWALVLLGAGAAALNGRRGRAGPIAALVGLYLVLLLLTSSLTG